MAKVIAMDGLHSKIQELSVYCVRLCVCVCVCVCVRVCVSMFGRGHVHGLLDPCLTAHAFSLRQLTCLCWFKIHRD